MDNNNPKVQYIPLEELTAKLCQETPGLTEALKQEKKDMAWIMDIVRNEP